jgi:hypothetical protein
MTCNIEGARQFRPRASFEFEPLGRAEPTKRYEGVQFVAGSFRMAEA